MSAEPCILLPGQTRLSPTIPIPETGEGGSSQSDMEVLNSPRIRGSQQSSFASLERFSRKFPAKPPRFYIFKTLNFHCQIPFFNREP